ncbi:MAG: hypothetical protein HC825_04540 [Oscillatoriales cyanobacterium RM1_1_9]|nr:hypothetical protein [Oscillatoriales cyanobacterium SM2_3_0]NJO46451.1 hypothetical protein [Oscillatoriales cyanobacterium RM2_1_1]NJO71160.1 hypothetical protein [Oscillatoriales cyanobacterium RM1_1_9]
MNENETGNVPKESALVETPSTEPVKPTTEEIQQSTAEVLEAIKRLVQSEMRTAGEFTRETYVKAMNQARDTIEKIRVIDQEEIEASFQNLETKTEQNWRDLVEDLADFSDRIAGAARAAWQVLTEPRDKDKP